jgi:hypothetical protein
VATAVSPPPAPPPSASLSSASKSATASAARAAPSGAGPAAAASSEVAVFSFPLRDTAATLNLWPVDVAHVERVVLLSRLNEVTPAATREALVSASGGAPSVSVPASLTVFQAAVRTLVPGGEKLSTAQRQFVSRALDGAYLVLVAVGRIRGGGSGGSSERAVSTADVFLLLLLCCGGNKSEKLGAAFDAFCENQGGMSQSGLAHMLRTTLWCLFACRDPSTARSEAAAGDTTTVSDVSSAARAYAEAVFIGASLDASLALSFERFADFYSNGGFEVLPWLELFSLRKFVPGAAVVQQEQGRATGGSHAAAAAAATAGVAASAAATAGDENRSDVEAPASLPETAESAEADSDGLIFALDSDAARSFSSSSGLDAKTPVEVARAVLAHAGSKDAVEAGSEHLMLTRQAYFNAVRQLVQGASLSESLQKSLTSRFSALFDSAVSLSRELVGRSAGNAAAQGPTARKIADAVVVVAALLPFCALADGTAGRSAASKLAVLWDLSASGPLGAEGEARGTLANANGATAEGSQPHALLSQEQLAALLARALCGFSAAGSATGRAAADPAAVAKSCVLLATRLSRDAASRTATTRSLGHPLALSTVVDWLSDSEAEPRGSSEAGKRTIAAYLALAGIE